MNALFKISISASKYLLPLAIFILLCLAIGVFKGHSQNQPIKPNISHLELEGNYEEIIDILKNHGSLITSDADLLFSFVQAIAETNSGIPKSIESKYSDLAKFIDGYLALRKGETRNSNKIFDSIENLQLKNMGHLEQYSYTEDFIGMEKFLNSSEHFVDEKVITRYKLPLFRSLNKKANIESLLEAESLTGDNNKWAKIYLLEMEGKLSQALELIDSSFNDEMPLEFVLEKANLISMISGFEVSKEFLFHYYEKYPKNPHIKEAYAIHLLNSSTTSSIKGLDLLLENTRNRNDVVSKLLYENYGFDYGNQEALNRFYKELTGKSEDLEPFVLFNLLMAKLSLLQDNQNLTHSLLEKMEQKAPFHSAYLWFAFQNSERQKDWPMALVYLKKFKEIDPANPFVAEKLDEISEMIH